MKNKINKIRKTILSKSLVALTLALVFLFVFIGCQTQGLVYTKKHGEDDHDYISVTGGGLTNYTSVKIEEAYDAAYVEVIGEKAFLDCKQLVEINIPRYVTMISFQAFKGCESLPRITLPTSLEIIGSEAFKDCKSLTGITLPINVVEINMQAFQNCTGLVNVNMPEYIESKTDEEERVFLEVISERLFLNCFSLEYINVPDGVTNIALGAFENCFSLSSFTLPKNLATIEGIAFLNCTSLEKIEFPATLTDVGYQAFAGCTSLTEVIINGDTVLEDDVFQDSPVKKITSYSDSVLNFSAFDFTAGRLSDLDIRVKPEAYAGYMSDADWSNLAAYISVIEPDFFDKLL